MFALFTSEENFVDEIDLIEKISDAGLDFLYVQKPRMHDLELERFLLALPERIRQKTFLCGSPNAAQEFGLLGFHQTFDWMKQNEAAVLRTNLQESVFLEKASDLQKLSIPLRKKISQILLPGNENAENLNGAFFCCDATEKPAGIENAAFISGIWEFADSVAAWKRFSTK